MAFKSTKTSINSSAPDSSSSKVVNSDSVYSNSVYTIYDTYVEEVEVDPTIPVVEPTEAHKLPEQSSDNGLITDLNNTNHYCEIGVDNSGRGDYCVGSVSYDENNSYIYADPTDTKFDCHVMGGACETDKYIIVSYINPNNKLGKIVFYDKKTNEQVGEFYSEKLGHSNGLTTDGDKVYIATGNDLSTMESIGQSGALGDGDKGNYKDSRKVASFSIEEAVDIFEKQKDDPFYNGLLGIGTSPNITVEDFRVGINNGVGLASLTSMGYDQKNGVTAFACGSKVYVVKGDKITEFTKINYDEKYSEHGEGSLDAGHSVYANENQDICVANDHVYVIRGKIPKSPDSDTSGESHVITSPYSSEDRNLPLSEQVDGYNKNDQYNVIDIYDLEGNYKGTQYLALPEGRNDNFNQDGVDCYRELESISYDEATDSFTLYYSNSFTNATFDHVIVRGVKIDTPTETAPIPRVYD